MVHRNFVKTFNGFFKCQVSWQIRGVNFALVFCEQKGSHKFHRIGFGVRSWDGSDCLADAGSTRVLSIAPEIVSYLTLEISAFWQAEDFDLTDRQTDGRTDRRTPFSSLVRAGIPCRAKKN